MQLRCVLSVIIAFVVAVTAYKKGPPVGEHPEICGSMSPKAGHEVDPLSRPAPLALSFEPACYDSEKPVVVKLYLTNNGTYFEGFFVQARLASSLEGNRPLQLEGIVLDGTFDTMNDSQLQTLTCGNSTEKNALGHSQAKKYKEKKFSWTPAKTFHDTVQFVATVVHEKDEYWMRVTSPSLRHKKHCLTSGASMMPMTVFPSALSFVFTIAAVLGMS